MKSLLPIAFVIAIAFATVMAQVPYSRIQQADGEPGAWLTYSGSYRSLRFSSLDQINRANVASLKPIWVYQARQQGAFEATPLVADDVMYLTEPQGPVVAIDPRTGRSLWRWDPPLPKDVRTLGFSRVNRGVALLDSTVFVGTLDAHLVALDAISGAVRWNVTVGDNRLGYSITTAPLAIDGKILVGISGGEAGIRGFLDAYDPATGKRLWRFYTIPGPGEPGHDSWAGQSWKTGGGPTWLTGSFDPELNVIYWGIGNPGPDWNGDTRAGDNLYTCALVALDAATGTLKWHFQFTPHDVHDWDANQIPVLLDVEIGGRPRKVVAMANRNGFYYLLDRQTGEFLLGRSYAKQTWASGLDAKGRPILEPNQDPSVEGTLTYPSLQGSTNWFSPSYSPGTGLFYVAVREMGSYFHKGEVEYIPGAYFTAGGETLVGGDQASGAIRALDARTGEKRWEFPLMSPPWGGVMSTAGGLVFGGSNEGNVYALDADTGKALWEFQTGGAMGANPMTFTIAGKQLVAIAAGQSLFVFGLP